MRDDEPSVTAKLVAAQRLGFARVPAPYGDPEADDRLQRDVADDTVASSGPMSDYLAARTVFFDAFVVETQAQGIDQMVTVGAGYDGRAMRYARPGLSWFELDHPDTQADKRRRLDRLGLTPLGVTFVPLDFATGDLPQALPAAGFDRRRPTALVCEGVASYLERAILDRLLADLAHLCAPTSRLGLSLLVRDGSGSNDRLGRVVASVGEPLQCVIDRGGVRPLLEEARWSVTRAVDTEGVAIEQSERGSALVLAERRVDQREIEA